MNHERILTEVARNLQNAARDRTRDSVGVETAKAVRAEMARAGRSVVELIRRGKIDFPEGMHPWLELALAERGGFWKVQLSDAQGSLFKPFDDSAPSFSVYSDECIVHWIANEQHRADGIDFSSIEDAVRSQITHRHVFLEATANWLWQVVGTCQPDLVLPVWCVRATKDNMSCWICLVSDWHEPFSKSPKYAGCSEMALACADACTALSDWLKHEREAVRRGSASKEVNDGESSSQVAEVGLRLTGTPSAGARDRLPPQVKKAYNAYLFARQLVPDETSALKLYEVLEKRPQDREMLPRVRGEIISAETFRRYVAEAERRLDGRKRGVCQRLRGE